MKVEIPKHYSGCGSVVLGDNKWDMDVIWGMAENLEPFDLHLASLDMSVMPWGCNSILTFLYHVQRINQANLEYPVIQNPFGYVIDGWHRIAKAILEGKETVKCVRLIEMPEPSDKVNNK